MKFKPYKAYNTETNKYFICKGLNCVTHIGFVYLVGKLIREDDKRIYYKLITGSSEADISEARGVDKNKIKYIFSYKSDYFKRKLCSFEKRARYGMNMKFFKTKEKALTEYQLLMI